MKINYIHIPISIMLYLVCLSLPGYYIGEEYKPQMALEALTIGWLGPIGGHVSWYANPLFLLALVLSSRPQTSCVIGFISLFLAISFMSYKTIIVSEAPTYSPIVAYGWGYGLWVTSIAVFSIGQLLHAQGIESNRTIIASLVSCGVLLAAYATYYFIGDSSIYAIRSQRDIEFEKRCLSAGEHIFRKVADVKGIFFDPDWEVRIFSKREGKTNFSFIGGAGMVGLGHLNSGYLLFYKTRDRDSPDVYVKYTLGNRKGFKSNRLESEYAVVTDYYSIPSRLNISGATVSIKSLRDNSVVAASTFFIEKESGKFCGNARGGFTTSSFITEVLGLTRKYPSAYK